MLLLQRSRRRTSQCVDVLDSILRYALLMKHILCMQLARKYHPDTNPDKSAKEKFVEIQDAYEVCSLIWCTIPLR